MSTYHRLRRMKGRGTPTAAASLARSQAIRVDGVKYAVQAAPVAEPTGSLAVEVYSEDNQYDTLYLAPNSTVPVIGEVKTGLCSGHIHLAREQTFLVDEDWCDVCEQVGPPSPTPPFPRKD